MTFKIFFGILKSSSLTTWLSHYKSSGINIPYHISVVVRYTLEFQIGSNSPHSVFAYETINSCQYFLFPSHEDRAVLPVVVRTSLQYTTAILTEVLDVKSPNLISVAP